MSCFSARVVYAIAGEGDPIVESYDDAGISTPTEYTMKATFKQGEAVLFGAYTDVTARDSWEDTGDLDHMLIFPVDYVDPENEENGAYIYFVLRPWGMDWEDVRNADTADMLYADMMPVEYEDWYLPQIRG